MSYWHCIIYITDKLNFDLSERKRSKAKKKDSPFPHMDEKKFQFICVFAFMLETKMMQMDGYTNINRQKLRSSKGDNSTFYRSVRKIYWWNISQNRINLHFNFVLNTLVLINMYACVIVHVDSHQVLIIK